MPKQAFLEAGQIVGTHGVRGEVRVQPWCDSPALFATLATLYWDKAGASPSGSSPALIKTSPWPSWTGWTPCRTPPPCEGGCSISPARI